MQLSSQTDARRSVLIFTCYKSVLCKFRCAASPITGALLSVKDAAALWKLTSTTRWSRQQTPQPSGTQRRRFCCQSWQILVRPWGAITSHFPPSPWQGNWEVVCSSAATAAASEISLSLRRNPSPSRLSHESHIYPLLLIFHRLQPPVCIRSRGSFIWES